MREMGRWREVRVPCREVRGNGKYGVATRLLEEVLQVLDLALELAQLRKPLLVLPLLSVELGDQRLLLGARQRAAAAVGDAAARF